MHKTKVSNSAVGILLTLSMTLQSFAQEQCIQPSPEAIQAVQTMSPDTRLAVLDEMDRIIAAKELEIESIKDDALNQKLAELQKELQKLSLKDPVQEAELSKSRGMGLGALAIAALVGMSHPQTHNSKRILCGAFAFLLGTLGIDQLSQNVEVQKSKILKDIKTLRWKINETKKQIAATQLMFKTIISK